MRANGPFALDNGVFRLREHGTFLSFSETCGSERHMFRKKNVMFHPAGGESGRLSRQTPGFGTDRVTPCYLQELRGGHANRAFHPMEAGCACGSMVLFDLFHKNFALRAKFL